MAHTLTCLQGQSPPAARSSVASRRHPLASQGSLPSASTSASSSSSLSLPCFLPVPESQPVLPALLRRLLQQGALPEALALAKRHEGGPHFKRSLEWLLFTTLDMEGSKCKPGKTGAAAAAASSAGGWQQQQPLHVLQGGLPGAAAGVLGWQGKVGLSQPWCLWFSAHNRSGACCSSGALLSGALPLLCPRARSHSAAVAGGLCYAVQGWLGHVDGQPHPVPVTPLLSAAVDLVLSFEQCLGEDQCLGQC